VGLCKLVVTGGKIADDVLSVGFQNVNIMKIAKIVKMIVEEDFLGGRDLGAAKKHDIDF